MNEDIFKQEKLLQELEHDPVAFIEIFLERELSKKQKLFLKETRTKKHLLAIWSRQTGKSTVIASYIVWRLLYGKGTVVQGEHMCEKIAIVAPIKDQIVNLYKKIKTLVDKSEFIASFVIKMNSAGIEMKNGNEAKMMSASPGSQIRGYTATCIVIDESQDITDEKYSADILPFGATTNALVIEAGTPKTKNHFYNALNSKNVTVVKQPWYECPFLSEEYVMAQKELSTEALWRQEYLCCDSEVTIISPNPKRIADIREGDQVYNNEGKLVTVKGLLKHYIEEEVLKITMWAGNAVMITKNHPIYSMLHKKKGTSELTFRNLEELKVRDYIHFPHLKDDNKRMEYIELANYVNIDYNIRENRIYSKKANNILYKEKKYISTSIPNRIALNKDVLKTFGLWVAEGYVSAEDKQLKFCLGTSHKEDIKLIQETFKIYFEKESITRLQNESNSATVITINNKLLCNFFINNFGKGAQNKKIPEWIFKLSKKQVGHFLDGYYSGDGHQNDQAFSCTSSSKKLMFSLKKLLILYNIYGRVAPKRKKKGKKIIQGREVTVRPSWRFSVSGLAYNRLAELLNNPYEKKYLSKTKECNGYDLLKIKEIEKIQYKGNVYNLETDDNHTYLTEIGSVHNCEFMEEGVLAFPSRYFEPEKIDGKLTGRWNLSDYDYIKEQAGLNKAKVIEITKLLQEGATYTAGLDLGRQKDNTVYTVLRTDIRPIRLAAKIKFVLGTDYSDIAKAIAMFHRAFEPTEFNIDYTNEKAFIEILQAAEVPVIVDQKQGRGALQFTNKNKNEMVTTAQILLEKYHFQLPKMDDGYISEFLNQQFEIVNKLKKFFHPSNEHDDSLWSTLLALKNVSYLSIDEIAGWANPWEAQDEKRHGPNRKIVSEVLVTNAKLRRRNVYFPAEMRRGSRSS